jgi:hypothetical protein
MWYPKVVRWCVWTLALGAAVVLVVSILLAPEDLPQVPGCGFRTLTGLPCPGCVLTRSFCAISHGRFGEAWALNPFGFVFYALALLCLCYPWFSRRFPRAVEWCMKSSAAFWAPLGLVVVMWLHGVWRIACLWRG